MSCFFLVPHTRRDQTWLVLGAVAGAAFAYHRYAKSRAAPQRGIASVSREDYGDASHALYTLRNGNGMTVKVSSLGCALTEVVVPTGSGTSVDVVCGYDSLHAQQQGKHNFGTIVGRYANRIRGGKYSLDHEEFTLDTNNGPNHLHGGPSGFFSRNFDLVSATVTDSSVDLKLAYFSPDGEEGYGGDLAVTMTYSLSRGKRDALTMIFEGTAGVGGSTSRTSSHRATVVNLTNHAYWNLCGHASGPAALLSHELWLPRSSEFTVVDASLATTGETAPVRGGSATDVVDLDYSRGWKKVDPRLDHNFCVGECVGRDELHEEGVEEGMVTVAMLQAPSSTSSPRSKRLRMLVSSNQVGVQIYAGGGIDPRNPQWQVPAKGGVTYQRNGAICIETQNWPDALNHAEKTSAQDSNAFAKHCPSSVIRPGAPKQYRHVATYAFQMVD